MANNVGLVFAVAILTSLAPSIKYLEDLLECVRRQFIAVYQENLMDTTSMMPVGHEFDGRFQRIYEEVQATRSVRVPIVYQLQIPTNC